MDGGYYDTAGNKYIFFLTDHLGNNRVVADQAGAIVQKNHYYPFGMSFAETPKAEQEKQQYKYNGKELDQLHGLNLYDYSARHYDPAIGRFTTMDPKAEKYYSISPYAYVANNPLKYIDPDGDTIKISIHDAKTQSKVFYSYGKDSNGNYGFIGKDGEIYSGDDEFANSLSDALGRLREGRVGRDLVDYLAEDTRSVEIQNYRENIAEVESNRIGWSNNDNYMPGGLPSMSFVGLGHEMAHIQDSWMGTYDKSPWTHYINDKGKEEVIPNAEKYALHIENQIRAEHRMALREYYSYSTRGYPNRDTRFIKNGASMFYSTSSFTITYRNRQPVTTIINTPFTY